MLSKPVPGELETPLDIAAFEVKQVCPNARLSLCEDWSDSYSVEKTEDAYTVTGGRTGVLYGTYALIRTITAGAPLPEGRQTPYYPLRMLDCWDNMDGTTGGKGACGDPAAFRRTPDARNRFFAADTEWIGYSRSA